MSPRIPPTRTWAETSTPEAEAEITAAVRAWLDAVPNRDEAIRKHYAAGVDPRDLARIAREAGWAKCTADYLARILKGAREETGADA